MSHQLTPEMIALVRSKMEEKSINHSQLSKRMDVSASAITKLVNGGRTVAIDRLFKLSVALEFNFFAVIAQKEQLRSLPNTRANFRNDELEAQLQELRTALEMATQRAHDLEVENRTLLKVLQQSKS